MDYVTRQFINLTKKFRKELRPLLTRVADALEKHARAIDESTKTSQRQQKNSPRPEVTIVNQLPPSIQVHQNEQDTRGERNYRRAVFLLSALSLGGFVIYAALVYWQYKQMIVATTTAKQSADAAMKQVQTNFVSDERPYIWITDDLGPFFVNSLGSGNTSRKMGFNFHVKNFGKSPAIHCQMSGRILLGEKAEEQVTFDTTNINPQWGTILPPGKEAFNTAWSDKPIADPNLLQKINTSGIVVHVLVAGYIYYADTYGNTYSSEFCLWRNPALTLTNCKTHNWIK